MIIVIAIIYHNHSRGNLFSLFICNMDITFWLLVTI